MVVLVEKDLNEEGGRKSLEWIENIQMESSEFDKNDPLRQAMKSLVV